jgi:hypothetical protein
LSDGRSQRIRVLGIEVEAAEVQCGKRREQGRAGIERDLAVDLLPRGRTLRRGRSRLRRRDAGDCKDKNETVRKTGAQKSLLAKEHVELSSSVRERETRPQRRFF